METTNLSNRIKQEKSEHEKLIKQKEQEKIQREIAARRHKQQKQDELTKKLLLRFLSFLICLSITGIGYYEGIVQADGSLFRGLFMQLLFLAGAAATIATFVRIFMAFSD